MAWLQIQVLCGRRHLHAMFLEGEQRKFPARQRTEVDPNDRPIAVFTGVGYAGWALPDYAIIDRLGLNDYVAARTPIERGTWVIPEEILVPLLALADANGDTRTTREELRIAFGSLPNTSEEDANNVVEFILLLFALEDGNTLSKQEAEKIAPTFAAMRFMAHDRRAPKDYINAFDPNVTVKNGKSTVRHRATPLTHERVRMIETEWRERLKNAAGK